MIQDNLSNMDSQRSKSNSVAEIVDDDEVPLEYRIESHKDKCNQSINTPPRRKKRSSQTSQPAPADESPRVVQTIVKLKDRCKAWLRFQEPQEQECDTSRARAFQDQISELEREFNNTLQGKELEWRVREEDLQRKLRLAQNQSVERELIFEGKIRSIHLEKSALEEQHNAFIRKQQEASFRQMESGRWLPVDETKIMSDLDRLKRDMRSWAKIASLKDTPALFGEKEPTTLMQQLSNVVVLENGQFPEGISTTAKSPMLLLNALLADHVYMSFFRSPFFFIEGFLKDFLPNCGAEDAFEYIYQRGKSANKKDAHAWRSQTLRLLMPPLRDDMPDSERELNHKTEEIVSWVADQQATIFLTGPASFLVDGKPKPDIIRRLKKIYSEAAKQSYMLWTRRTDMRCLTLRDMKQQGFDAESPYFDSDTLVRYDEHEDQLKGRPVTMLVHPLLEVAGNDEGRDYDQKRVWVKGVVWLNSKIE